MKNIRNFIKFSLLGGIGVFVAFLLLYFLTEFLGLWYLASSLIGGLANYLVSFYVHKFWTFKEKQKERTRKEMILYFLVVLGYFLTDTFLMYILTDHIKIQYLSSKTILIFVLSVPNYWATERVFRNGKKVLKPGYA